MRKRKPEDTLEEALNERTIPDDPEMAALARVADRLERGLDAEAPDAYRERALFIQGVAARKPGFPWGRIFAPMAAAAVLVAFFAISRTAGPGDSLYGVRKALDKVGLAEDPSRDADDLMDEAADQIVEAEALVESGSYASAKNKALDARITLREARALLLDAREERREEGLDRYEDLDKRADEVFEEADEEMDERAEERLEERLEESQDDDNPGKGGGDDSGGDDNSGKGGGDDSGGDDNSGSGSDDSGGDDNSGSGSDDDSGGDDSSGSGSGGDDSSGDDNSGSGGGDDD